jgi:hypothetical protein
MNLIIELLRTFRLLFGKKMVVVGVKRYERESTEEYKKRIKEINKEFGELTDISSLTYDPDSFEFKLESKTVLTDSIDRLFAFLISALDRILHR